MSEVQSTGEAFFKGCKSGWDLCIYGIMPRVMVAFMLVFVLSASGCMQWLGRMFAPVMSFWALPGEAAVVLATALISNAAAVGTIVSMFAVGTLTAEQVTILMPGLYLMGALFQFSARVLETAGVSHAWWPVMWLICFVNSAFAMFVMKMVLL